MKPNRQNRRTYIIVGAILFFALVGLFFVRNDYVAADGYKPELNQTQSVQDAATSPDFGESVSVMPSLIRIFSALVLVIAAIYGGIYLLKKMMGRRYVGLQNKGNLEVLETIHIAPRKTITLLRVGEKSVLVGTTESSMSLLSELDVPETTRLAQLTESEATSDNFGNFLKAAVDKFKEVTRKRHAAL